MQIKQVSQNESVTFIICRTCKRALQVVEGSLCHRQSLCHRCSEVNDKNIVQMLKINGRYGVA